MNKETFNFALELITNELEESRFKESGVALLTHYLNSRYTIPEVPAQVYEKISELKI